MCYNYETMIRRAITRSIHKEGAESVLANLTEQEKRIWEQRGPLADEGNIPYAENGKGDFTSETASTFPGAEVQVIPITTKEREYYYFGFLPDWAIAFNDHRKNFNARAETIREKPSWKKAWKNNQRCLVSAKGFYEDDKPNKRRYFFSVKDKEEIFFAGIFNHWKNKETGEIVKTFAIITSEPNELVNTIHPRMPVVLNDDGIKIWMDPHAPEESVYSLLRPFPADQMLMAEAPKPPRKKKASSSNELF